MSIEILYHNDQTRRAVISAFQGGSTVIGWILTGDGAGAVYNPAVTSGPQLFLVPDVTDTLNSIAPASGLLVQGNSGISITSGIAQSTVPISVTGSQSMLSDDYVSSQLLQNVTFESGMFIQALK